MTRSILALALLALAAPSIPAADPALHGIAVADLDRSAKPCDDFFEFANGAWRAANPIPASMPRWSRRWEAGENAKDRLKLILDEVAARSDWPAGSPEQLIGDYYGACMDEARVNAAGARPIEPLLRDIDAIKDVAGVQAMIGRLRDLTIAAPFAFAAFSDNHEPTNVIAHIIAAGLGLPDRDYYVKTDARFVEARDKYKMHVAKVFALAGAAEAQAKAAAESVFAFEKQLAEASLDNVALRDPAQTDHKMPFAELQKLTPRFDWAAYFDSARVPKADLNVFEPRFLQEVDRKLGETPVADWKTYLRWQALRSAAPFLSADFATEAFEFDE
jgi:endothelin-converting enzyme/putative endopeptidase